LAHVRRFFIRQPRGTDQDQRFSLVDGQFLKRAIQVAQMQLRIVIGSDSNLRCAHAVWILDFEFSMSKF
jgi:hypothetical protein